MTDKFKVSDRVRIIKNSCTKTFVGLEATILSAKHSAWCVGLKEIRHDLYHLDIQGEGSIRLSTGNAYGFPEDWLAPIYDGWEKTTWEDCYKVTGWKPKEVVKLD